MLKNKCVGRGYTNYILQQYISSLSLYKQDSHLNCFQGQRRNLCSQRKPNPTTSANSGKQIIEDGCFDFSNAPLAAGAPLATALYGIHENPKSIYYKMEDQTKGGSDSNIATLLVRDCTDEGTVVEKQKNNQEELTSVKEGDIIDLRELLFTKNRNYLIKYNGIQVKAEQLAGKVIVIYFVLLPPDYNSAFRERWDIAVLRDVYNYLPSNKGFEVIFVAVDDIGTGFDEEKLLNPSPETNLENHFRDVFSCMPWAAIPFSDITSRKYLQRRFGFINSVFDSTAFVIDSTGMVLQKNAHWCFDCYGALGYPFSWERLNFLESEYEAIAAQPSLAKLLSSPQRDYLISNNGKKVPIHTLEDKVVALYFYDSAASDMLLEELKEAYKELAERNENFEVVLLYLCDTLRTSGRRNENTFWKSFKSMPWLALPYNDPTIKKLEIIYQYPREEELVDEQVSMLVIIGPHGEFCEPCGADILLNFKVPGYPFTREKVLKLETEKIKELKLEMLWEPNTVFRGKNGSQVSLSQLTGKRIILLFGPCEDEFLNMLEERYLCMKDTDGEFEVIHIYIPVSEDSEDPAWFPYPLQEDFLHASDFLPFEFDKRYLKHRETYDVGDVTRLLAFDQDGMIVRDTAFPTIEDMNFPFYTSGLEKETLFQLDTVFHWYDLDATKSYSCRAGYVGPNQCCTKPMWFRYSWCSWNRDTETFTSNVKFQTSVADDGCRNLL